jgi:hypothetical protein
MRLTTSAITQNAAPIVFGTTRFSARRGLALLCLLTGLGVSGWTSPASASTASDRARVSRAVSPINARGLAPQVRITSPVDGDFIATGKGSIGNGNPNGTGFVINVEVVTHDQSSLAVDEDVNIRNVNALGSVNPHFPGLFVFIDEELIKPDGGTIAANTNLGPLFNIAGTDDTPGPGVTVWAGWHVLESIRPRGDSFHVTVAVIDSKGRIGTDRVTLFVDPTQTDRFGTSGGGLTQNPGEPNRVVGGTAPIVSIVAPREPTAVTFGEAPPNGSLHFIQVSIIDREGDVVVDELGGADGLLDPANPNLAAQFARIDDGAAGVGNPNRNVPGFDFQFDVPSGAAAGGAKVNVARLFNIAGSEVVLLEDGTPAVRTVLDWVVAAPFVGSAFLEQFVTFTATVTDANGNQGIATRTFQLTDSAANGDALTPQPAGF